MRKLASRNCWWMWQEQAVQQGKRCMFDRLARGEGDKQGSKQKNKLRLKLGSRQRLEKALSIGCK